MVEPQLSSTESWKNIELWIGKLENSTDFLRKEIEMIADLFFSKILAQYVGKQV